MQEFWQRSKREERLRLSLDFEITNWDLKAAGPFTENEYASFPLSYRRDTGAVRRFRDFVVVRGGTEVAEQAGRYRSEIKGGN